jgi:hypothetical protein
VTVTVMAAPPSVPTLSTWGLALLALLLSLTGCPARFSRKARFWLSASAPTGKRNK